MTPELWWRLDGSYYELFVALEQFAQQNPRNSVGTCRSWFDGLNVLWTCRRRAVPGAADQSDNKAIQEMLLEIAQVHGPATLLGHPDVAALASLDPPILDHDVLRRSADYHPGQEVPAQLHRDAAATHQQFKRALERWTTDASAEHATAAVKKLATTLYIVRCNINHGEKTPSGPDLKKAQRDRHVCATAQPVIGGVIELLLDRPATRLAAYGTLRPGCQNAAMLDGVEGQWTEGTVEAVKIAADPPAIVLRYGAPLIPASVLCSEMLPDRWQALDRFEGSEYHRCLAPVRLQSGRIIVANIYASAGQEHE